MASERIRYRRVSARMWNDRKFLELSSPKPNGRDLWVWLICGPLTTPVPGVVLASLVGMADRLQWPLAATKRCWDEIAKRQMATADWSHSLVWLPKALEHNRPESPNVVKSWRKYLDEHVPECRLRTDLEAATLTFLQQMKKPNGESLGPSFAKAFMEAFTKGITSSFAQSGNREQDLQEPPLPPSGEGGARFTRAELNDAKADLRAFRSSQPAYVPSFRREPGVEYLDPRHCPHEPECAEDQVCVAKLAAERRSRVARGLAGVAS